MEATAKARYQRISPRKARVVVDMVRGRNAAEALEELRYTRKGAAPLVAKVLESAVANAEHLAKQRGESVDLDALYVKLAYVDKAPDRHMRRWRPRAMGRATRIVQGMSHITIVVSDE